MTREEQMKAAAKCESSDELQRITFCIGALWADRNPKSPWISAEERMPNEHQLVVMTHRSKYDGKRYYETVYAGKQIPKDAMDYWMPIPELPKED